MKRRTLLAGIGAGAVGLSGCLAEGNGEDSDGETPDGGNRSDDSGDDPSGDGGAPPAIEDSSIETVASDCGSTDAGGATAERSGGEVRVEGVIGAPNPCHTAVLTRVEIHNRQLVLGVDVESRGDVCRECVGEVEYEATVAVANAEGLHGTTVEHANGDEHVTNWDEPEDTSP